MYVVYTSSFLVDEETAEILCMDFYYILLKIEGKYKVANHGNVDFDDESKWKEGQGIDISINNLGKPVEIERYLEPEDDDDEMAKYLSDDQ